jgi:hypothetical protein
MKTRDKYVETWNRFWFEPASALRLASARAMFCGAAFLFYLPHDFTEWPSAAPTFWMPMRTFELLHVPLIPAEWLFVLQIVWKVSLGLCAIGLWTRASAIVAAAGGTYLLGLPHNFGATQHYDTLVVFALVILAFSRAADVRSVDTALRGRRAIADDGEYTWPIRAMWVLTALVFFGAGTSKLRHSGLEWALSDNFRLLLMRAYYHVSDGDPLTRIGLEIAKRSWLSQAIALTSLGIETFYIVALFSRRARPYIAAIGILFFVGIRAFMGPTFEPYLICGLFLVPWHRVEYRARAWAHRVATATNASMIHPDDCRHYSSAPDRIPRSAPTP